MRPFDRIAPAAIILPCDRAILEGGELATRQRRLEFTSFDEAVRYFMTILAVEDRRFAKIATVGDDDWLLKDIERLFDVRRGVQQKLGATMAPPTTLGASDDE